jgi:hypothetical protein
METLKKIQELEIAVKNANTTNTDGRQIVANLCKKLYNLIEEALYNRFGENAVNDAYTDLCKGNFAEPFMCEKKKEKFTLYKTIYTNNLA